MVHPTKEEQKTKEDQPDVVPDLVQPPDAKPKSAANVKLHEMTETKVNQPSNSWTESSFVDCSNDPLNIAYLLLPDMPIDGSPMPKPIVPNESSSYPEDKADWAHEPADCEHIKDETR